MATQMLNADADIITIQDLLGHSRFMVSRDHLDASRSTSSINARGVVLGAIRFFYRDRRRVSVVPDSSGTSAGETRWIDQCGNVTRTQLDYDENRLAAILYYR